MMQGSIRRERHRAPSLPARRPDQSRWLVFLAFLAACFLLGGGARTDITSLIVLRPISWLAVGYAWASLPRVSAAAQKMPLVLLLALAALLVLQLIPLPPDAWRALPGRDLIASIDRDAGLVANWRPLSLSPSRTLNSLFAMGVPIAAALLVLGLDMNRRRDIVWALVAAGLASALLGLLQVLGPSESSLYTYRISNFGTPTGLFANRNHQAVFLASLLPLVAYQLLRLRGNASDRARPMLLALLLSASALFIALVLATGSRAGTVLALAAILASASLWYGADRKSPRFKKSRMRPFVVPAALAASALMAALMFANSRSPGVDRLFSQSLADEMRFQVLPVLWHMAKAYFPVGTGFGSFYLAYQVAEPHALLQTSYLNQAHDDLLQIVIEGGLPAVLLLAGALIWFAWSGWRCARAFFHAASIGRGVPLGIFAWLSLAVVLAASLVDYPMRTPAFMALTAILATFVGHSSATSVTARVDDGAAI